MVWVVSYRKSILSIANIETFLINNKPKDLYFEHSQKYRAYVSITKILSFNGLKLKYLLFLNTLQTIYSILKIRF